MRKTLILLLVFAILLEHVQGEPPPHAEITQQETTSFAPRFDTRKLRRRMDSSSHSKIG